MLAHRHGRRPRPREQADPGAAELLAQWRDTGTPFLVLTNNPFYTPRDLSARLRISGLEVPEDRIWTSALATAEFLRSQHPGGTAFVIGEAGLTTALHEAGYVQTETQPDYVVVGETRNYSFDRITQAIRFINAGALHHHEPGCDGPDPTGIVPATGSFAALITHATGKARTSSASRTR
jgi:NagD protein